MQFRIKRRMYKRGSSFETTIPLPLVFKLDQSKKNSIIFTYYSDVDKWYVTFENLNERKGNDGAFKIKRKLYVGKNSIETTLPVPLIFKLNQSKKHYVIFNYDKEVNEWFITFEERDGKKK